jgi:hypothetical protein
MIVKIYIMDYGNSLTPWSVGKYAKRSATIHLNSNDVMPNNAHQFADAMIVDQTATGIALSDVGGVIRTAVAGEASKATVHLPGGEESTVDVALGTSGDASNPGFYANDATFTNLCQLNVQEPAALEGASCFLLPIPETGYAVDGGGELTDDTLVEYIRRRFSGAAPSRR